MRICIINGNPSSQNIAFEETIGTLTDFLNKSGHHIVTFLLRDLKIKYCEGCLNCWFKTPGECSFNDDSKIIRFTFMNSDLVIFTSPIIAGFTSALLKKAMDKLIPLVLPYFELSDSEVHHKGRYPIYPKLGVFLEKSPDTTFHDLEIINGIFARNAINLKTSIGFSFTSEEPIEKIVNEISCF